MGERLNWQEVRRAEWSEPRPPAPNGSTVGGTDYYERTWERVTWPDDGTVYAGRTYEQQWTRIGPEEGRYHVVTEHSQYPATEEYGSRLPVTTTDLAAWLTGQPRFRDHSDSGLFNLLAGIYGRDFTGLAFVQACLKADQEREVPGERFKARQQVTVSKDGRQVPGTVFRRILANGVWMLRVDTAEGRLTVHPDRVESAGGAR